MEKPYITIDMPDGTIWAVPAKVVAKDRANYYAKKEPERGNAYQEEYNYALNNDYELIDWIANEMSWADIKAHAAQLSNAVMRVDYNEGICNGDKAVVR